MTNLFFVIIIPLSLVDKLEIGTFKVHFILIIRSWCCMYWVASGNSKIYRKQIGEKFQFDLTLFSYYSFFQFASHKATKLLFSAELHCTVTQINYDVTLRKHYLSGFGDIFNRFKSPNNVVFLVGFNTNRQSNEFFHGKNQGNRDCRKGLRPLSDVTMWFFWCANFGESNKKATFVFVLFSGCISKCFRN